MEGLKVFSLFSNPYVNGRKTSWVKCSPKLGCCSRMFSQLLKYPWVALWPIYIDRNPRVFGIICTKSLGVLGFQLSECLIRSKNSWDIPDRSSGLVCPSPCVLTYTESTMSQKPYPINAREFSVNVNRPLMAKTELVHLRMIVSQDVISPTYHFQIFSWLSEQKYTDTFIRLHFLPSRPHVALLLIVAIALKSCSKIGWLFDKFCRHRYSINHR